MGRLISLAAGTLPPMPAVDVIRVASGAGFELAGLRPDPARLGRTDWQEVAEVADGTGVQILDVEVVRLGTTPPNVIDQLIDYAAGVRAAHLLVVSSDEDRDRTADGFGRVCERAALGGVRAVLEFMRFTTVPDLGAAIAVAGAAGPRAGVLVDALHLARSGGTPADLLAIPAAMMPYVQLCDGPAVASLDPADLAEEARHHRLCPGAGELPLVAFLRAVPGVTVSVEVQCDAGWAAHTPVGWAQTVRREAALIVDRADGTGSSSSVVAGSSHPVSPDPTAS